MLSIPNLPTQDRYVDALTLGPVQSARLIKYVVANKAVFMRVWPQSKSGTIPAQTDELLVTPETNIITDAMGLQFRSALPGVPAQVIAQLLEPGDPTFGSGTPFSATISGSGGISPGVSAVQIQKDGANVGTEPIINFLTGLGLKIVASDDPANTRVLLELDQAALAYSLLAVAAASFDIQNIPATFADLELSTLLRNDAGGGLATNNLIRINNDAGASYNWAYDQGSGSGALSSSGTIADTSINALLSIGSGGVAGKYAGAALRLVQYANANAHKIVTGTLQWDADNTLVQSGARNLMGVWRALAAVNRIQVISSVGNFTAGSAVLLGGKAGT